MEINQALPINNVNTKQVMKEWEIQPIGAGKKEKVKSAVELSVAALLLKTYMAMSHLWLMADKIKKATNSVAIPKTSVNVKTSRAA